MRATILILLLCLSGVVSGQNIVTIEWQMAGTASIIMKINVKVDTIKAKICKERGHIKQGVSETLAYCPPYAIDTDSTTVMVYPACNWITYVCQRCGKRWVEKEEERRVTIWIKTK